jgi:two-component system OmpR family response regulator
VARVIKNHPEHGAIRVVMLTARSGFSDKQEGLRAGADDYIVKPIRLDELATRVEKNLEARARKS